MGRGSCAAAFVITLGVAAPSPADPIAFSNFAGNGVSTCCGGWGVRGGGLVGSRIRIAASSSRRSSVEN